MLRAIASSLPSLLFIISSGLLLSDCGKDNKLPQPSSVAIKEAWDADNAPSLMDTSFIAEHGYIANFRALPLSARLERLPWSDDYWPSDHGGIAYRWNASSQRKKHRIGYRLLTQEKLYSADLARLSPAEKYDIYQGEVNFPLTRSERKRTQVLKTLPGHRLYEPGFKIPYWEGLCHSWAPATLGYEEPRSVELEIPYGPLQGTTMPFGASDIKALLTYFLHEADSEAQSLGMRCYFDLKKLTRKLKRHEISEDEFNAEKRACDDTNAGAFHIVLANQIGRLKEGFLVDVTREEEVWNQPVYGYESKVLSEKAGASPGAAPGTESEVVVRTRIDYIVEVDASWEPQAAGEGKTEREYTYRLELDSNGDIIGGAWPSNEADRPDFLWKQNIPEFSGYFAPLKGIYEASIGRSTNTP